MLAKKVYFGHPSGGAVWRRCRRGRGAVQWCHVVIHRCKRMEVPKGRHRLRVYRCWGELMGSLM